MDDTVIQRILRHANVGVTRQRYIKIEDKVKSAAIKKVERSLRTNGKAQQEVSFGYFLVYDSSYPISNCFLDRLSSLLADQGRRYQNHPAPRAGRLAHPAGPRLADRDRPPLDNSLYRQLWPSDIKPFWVGAAFTVVGLLFAVWTRQHSPTTGAAP